MRAAGSASSSRPGGRTPLLKGQAAVTHMRVWDSGGIQTALPRTGALVRGVLPFRPPEGQTWSPSKRAHGGRAR